MSRPIALSTMYLQRWPEPWDLLGFSAAAIEMGFDGVELGHVVKADALARLRPGTVNVMAVHHPCPAVPGGPGAFDLLSADVETVVAATASVERSIDTAHRYGSSVVVLHLGRAAGEGARRARRLAFEVASRYVARQHGTSRYERAATELGALADALDEDHVDRAATVLRPLLAKARACGVALALETGYHPDELPRPGGMRRLLRMLAADGLTAWLDTGHVGAQVNQGLASFDRWLDAADGAWAGAHLHDVIGLRDHLPPGSGELDLETAVRALPPNAVLTCEIDWYFEAEEVREGRAAIARMTS